MSEINSSKRKIILRKYSSYLILIYLIFIPLLLILKPEIFVYSFTFDNNLFKLISIFIITFIIFSILFKKLKLKFQIHTFSKFAVGIFYGFLFAFSEELFFRGIIQSFIASHISNIILVIVLSSVIFGLAHLPNGAKGVNIKTWNWKFCALSFLAALPLSMLYAITNSLLLPTLLHTIFTSSLFLFYVEENNTSG